MRTSVPDPMMHMVFYLPEGTAVLANSENPTETAYLPVNAAQDYLVSKGPTGEILSSESLSVLKYVAWQVPNF